MISKNHPEKRYGQLSIGLHWFMLVLLVAVYTCMELSDAFPRGSDMRSGLRTWHYMLGLSVFALAWLRLAVNLCDRAPPVDPAPPLWQSRLARLVQAGLYLLMIVMPVAGWLLLSARGQPFPFFGLQLPALMAESKDAAGWIKEVHQAGATAGYFLVGLHALAALYHHYLLRDNTLTRMLSGRR
ncbi:MULTISPECIES: cytochrome b [unclassified Polaromonas]|uniref:cytochrome b n=1 Tax=unclassified Polaromonas TaxID=2638319 RepID=UPI000F07B389|nr:MULTISPECIES: cytochrome b [unclassified Polaromonas]AYQ29499.1 cytochrome b [Polaromonas sp. SP1]QGJ19385.1 cytochrome B [Polaromonas sp. Pch-P]